MPRIGADDDEAQRGNERARQCLGILRPGTTGNGCDNFRIIFHNWNDLHSIMPP